MFGVGSSGNTRSPNRGERVSSSRVETWRRLSLSTLRLGLSQSTRGPGRWLHHPWWLSSISIPSLQIYLNMLYRYLLKFWRLVPPAKSINLPIQPSLHMKNARRSHWPEYTFLSHHSLILQESITCSAGHEVPICELVPEVTLASLNSKMIDFSQVVLHDVRSFLRAVGDVWLMMPSFHCLLITVTDQD